MKEAALDRCSTTSQKPVEWRDPLGSINPFFDEPETEAEWGDFNLDGFPRGLDLVRVCLRAIWKDKEILVFQGTSMALCLGLLYIFMYWATEGFDREYFASPLSPEIAILRLFPYFILASFIGTYFNVAIMTVAIIRMKGGNPSSADGLEVATRKSPAILIWAIYSAIVMTVIFLLRSRDDRNGERAAHHLASTTELVFAAGTYFVVPVMIFENSSFGWAVKRSASIMKRTWKETLVGNLGMGLVFFLITVLGILVTVPIGMILGGVVGGVVAAVACIIVVLLLYSAANSVLVAALYWLARTGRRPASMEGYADLPTMAFGFEEGEPEDAFMTADELTQKYAR